MRLDLSLISLGRHDIIVEQFALAHLLINFLLERLHFLLLPLVLHLYSNNVGLEFVLCNLVISPLRRHLVQLGSHDLLAPLELLVLLLLAFKFKFKLSAGVLVFIHDALLGADLLLQVPLQLVNLLLPLLLGLELFLVVVELLLPLVDLFLRFFHVLVRLLLAVLEGFDFRLHVLLFLPQSLGFHFQLLLLVQHLLFFFFRRNDLLVVVLDLLVLLRDALLTLQHFVQQLPVPGTQTLLLLHLFLALLLKITLL